MKIIKIRNIRNIGNIRRLGILGILEIRVFLETYIDIDSCLEKEVL